MKWQQRYSTKDVTKHTGCKNDFEILKQKTVLKGINIVKNCSWPSLKYDLLHLTTLASIEFHFGFY